MALRYTITKWHSVQKQVKSCCQWMGTIVQYGNVLVTLIYRRKPKT